VKITGRGLKLILDLFPALKIIDYFMSCYHIVINPVNQGKSYTFVAVSAYAPL
jgi:hypothetical protein